MNTENSEAYMRDLQLRVLAGLLETEGTSKSTLRDFHETVFPETFVEPIFSEICRAAKQLYARTGGCDPIVLMSEIDRHSANFSHIDVRDAVSIVFDASKLFNVDSVTLSTYLPILNRAALAKALPLAQKELEGAVLAGTPYEDAYSKFVAPVVERFASKAHERFDVRRVVGEMRSRVEGFARNEIVDDRFVPTGFTALDGTLRGGMRPSQLIIVGARPATGKTTIALNMAANVIESSKDGHVVFVSLEQTADQLVEKIVSRKAGTIFPKTKIELERVRMSGGVSKLEEAAGKFDFSRFHVVEKTEDVEALSASVGEICARHKVAAVFVDYLQLIPSRPGERSRYEAITRISNRLKVLAKDASVPIVCLAQLSRSSENDNRDPRLSDLRDSGAIEQDADVGILLYNDRGESDDELSLSKSRAVNLDVQKNRNGGLTKIRMRFTPAESRFSES